MARILLIDDEADLLRALTMILKSRGHEVTALSEAVSAAAIVRRETFDVIISDIRMQPMDGLQLLDNLRKQGIETPIIMLTAYATLDVALQAIKNGAFDFITKPFKPDVLLDLVQQVIEQPVINGEEVSLAASIHQQWLWQGIVVRSHKMQDVRRAIEQMAPTNETILFMGEAGTGKRFAAEIVHALSSRSDKSFTAIDCAALNPKEAWTQLFGSAADSKDVFEKAGGGTIFLENSDALPESAGQKITEAIQSGNSAAANDPMRPRILASCRQLKESCRWMRQLAAFMVSLPPLRERIQDLLPLISFFIGKRSGGNSAANDAWTISTEAYQALAGYLWPRNVDELGEIIAKAADAADNYKLTAKNLPDQLIADAARTAQTASLAYHAEELRGRSFRDYVRRKQAEIKTTDSE